MLKLTARSFLLFLISYGAYSQSNSKVIIPSLGLQYALVQDQLFSPLVYSGVTMAIGFEKLKKTEKSITILELNVAMGKLKNNFENSINNTTGNLNYVYLKPVFPKKRFFVGAATSTKVAVRNFALAKSFGGESYSGDIFSTLNIAMAYQVNEKKWGSVFVKFDSPLMGIAFVRKNFNIISNPDLIILDANIAKAVLKTAEVISLSNLKSANLGLVFNKKIREKHAIVVTLDSQFYQYQRLNSEITSQNTTFSFGYSFMLKH